MVSHDQMLLASFAASRDEQAFVTLVRRYERLVRSVCRRVLRDQHLAEDAFQASFLILASQAKSLSQGDRPLAPWLQTVATNAALQLRRTRFRSQQREQVRKPSNSDDSLVELLGLLDEELQGLDRELREVIVLCCLEGETQDEAAKQIGVSKSTVRRRIESGLAELRNRFRRHGLVVPALALLANAIRITSASAAEPSPVRSLVESASQLPSDGSVIPERLLNIQFPNPLLQRTPTMTRWLRTHFWMATGISTATLLCVGVWPVITPTEAREKSKPEVARAQKANGNSGSSRTATQGQTAKKGSNSKPADPLKSELNPAAKNNELDVAAIPYEQPEAKVTTNVVTATGTSVQTATASGGGANGAFNGVININGKEVRTNDPAEFQKMLQQNGGLFPQLPLGANGGAAAAGGGANGGAAAGGGANGAFNGVININGKEVRTNDPAEFQKMLQQNGGLFPQLPQGANGGAAAAGGGANGGAAAGGATSKSTQRNINGKSTSSGSSKSSAKGRQGAKGNQPKAN